MLTQFTPKHCILNVSASDDFGESVQSRWRRSARLPRRTDVHGDARSPILPADLKK